MSDADPSSATIAGRSSSMPPLIRALRPRQWLKNLLVLAAPLAAGRIFDQEILLPALAAFLVFCAASSAVYLVNDAADREVDRLHPVKRHRPIASGELSVTTALVTSAVLAAVAIAGAALVRWELAAVVAGYALLQVGYSLWLKHEPVLDLAVVTLGFLLRAVAGGVAADLYISRWFFMVAGFGALFIVAGKRYSELHTLGTDAGTRRSLVRYTATYLRFVWSIAAAVTVTAYSLWAFEKSPGADWPWFELSIIPFVVGMLRYAVDIDAGRAAEPEDIVWDDRLLQGIGVVWLVIVCVAVLGS